MQIVLLGTAAGGGFPQWNCWCPSCRVARQEPSRARRRSQSSAAVSADGRRWFLLNASPDVHAQLERFDAAPPDSALRHVPVEGVVLTDAELDHTLGVVLLREARFLQLWTTDAVERILEADSRILPTTRAFAQVQLRTLGSAEPAPLLYRDGCPSGISVLGFPVPAGPPRFATEEAAGHTVGLLLRDDATGGVCAFVPGCGGLDDALLELLGGADLVLFDGTFWTDDELIRLRIGERTARQMDHLPVSGPDGSLVRLAALPARERVYTHINNTNPMLIEDGSERAAVESAGLRVGFDGMRFTL
ncbi:MAG TPA: pyrroloquinoline quinone biosynthesis protein PqqB [Gemmatimonadales bacterium]|nr:pyrroloquinoline quinone biosynthesis protein PqqB [Gemmatimonadales bacterium]